MEQAVSERRKAFAAAHRSDEDRRALSVIAKAKAEAWQTTCSSLSSRFNPKSVHSLLHSMAGSSSSSSSSPNFPTKRSVKPRALWSLARPFALLSHSVKFLWLPPTSPRPLPLVQTK